MVASALQSAGMHAFLVFPPGHAMVAVEVWNGAGEYFLIETTAVADNQNSRNMFVNDVNYYLNNGEFPNTACISYYSKDEWAYLLKNSIDYIVDCDDSRILGLTPFAN